MSKVNQIVSFNIKSQLDSLKPEVAFENYKDAINIFGQLSFCYENTITPNGSVKLKELNKMLDYDSEIAFQLNILSKVSNFDRTKVDLDYIKNLKDLIKEREDFIKSIRA
jgi:hypothetical protein